jgi:hypothetical protein
MVGTKFGNRSGFTIIAHNENKNTGNNKRIYLIRFDVLKFLMNNPVIMNNNVVTIKGNKSVLAIKVKSIKIVNNTPINNK